MASSSGRRSGSSASSRQPRRRTVHIPAGPDGKPLKALGEPKERSAGGGGRRHPRQGGDRSRASAARATASRKERERKAAAKRRAARLKAAAVVLAAIAVVVAVVALYRSSAFSIRQVEVVGAEKLTGDEVRALAAVPDDATLLRFPARDVEARVLADAWIAEVAVTRDFPDTMRIRVVEREPAALVDLGGTTFWVADTQGVMVTTRTPDASSTLAVVRDLPAFEPVAGRPAGSPELENALRVLAGLSPQLRGMVRAVSAPTADRTALITKGDVEILVGPAEDMEKKDLVARRILKEQAGKVVYMNVRTVERPTWRGLDAPK